METKVCAGLRLSGSILVGAFVWPRWPAGQPADCFEFEASARLSRWHRSGPQRRVGGAPTLNRPTQTRTQNQLAQTERAEASAPGRPRALPESECTIYDGPLISSYDDMIL